MFNQNRHNGTPPKWLSSSAVIPSDGGLPTIWRLLLWTSGGRATMWNEPWVWPEVGDAGTSGAGAVPLRSAQRMGQQKKKQSQHHTHTYRHFVSQNPCFPLCSFFIFCQHFWKHHLNISPGMYTECNSGSPGHCYLSFYSNYTTKWTFETSTNACPTQKEKHKNTVFYSWFYFRITPIHERENACVCVCVCVYACMCACTCVCNITCKSNSSKTRSTIRADARGNLCSIAKQKSPSPNPATTTKTCQWPPWIYTGQTHTPFSCL